MLAGWLKPDPDRTRSTRPRWHQPKPDHKPRWWRVTGGSRQLCAVLPEGLKKLDAERPVPRNHTPRTTGDHSGPTESDWDSTDCFLRTSSNGPSRRGGKRKSARERGLYRLPQCRVGARALFCTGIAKNLFSESTPFGGPTAGIASSRRDLTIRRAAAWIAEGLPRFALFCAESRL